jgi:AbrB family looped-hinge helix DNA binding protein
MKAKVSSKGQVVIPIALRRKFGIKIGDMVDLIVEEDGIKIVPVKEKVKAKDLAGIFSKYAKGEGIPTDKRIEEITEKEAVKRYKKSNT